MIKLSILIATMPARSPRLNALRQVLDLQLTNEVEVLTDCSMDYNVGTKRNRLLARSQGRYVVYIDDDDIIAGDYIKKILDATESEPDCVGISGIITTNGGNAKQWHISKDYGKWYEAGGVYYRTPNHISPIKREIAIEVGFPDLAFGEDYQYSMWALPFLKTEIKIPGILYYYQYVDKK